MRWSAEISDVARATIEAAAALSMPAETGGILIGWTGDTVVHIDCALEVSTPRRGRSSYTRNRDNANAALEAELADEPDDSPLGYVGEWHSHPAHVAASPIDLASMQRIAAEARTPVALIVAMNTGRTWALDTRVFRSRRGGPFQRRRRQR